MSEARDAGRAHTALPSSASVALRAQGIFKWFPGVRALRDVNFDLHADEVHGSVGENGAGKSTLVKIIVGAYAPDAGRVEAFGRGVEHADPRAARRAGIAAIYQELTIVPDMSAAANVFLGQAQCRELSVSRSATHRAFGKLCTRLGLTIDPEVRAGSLSVADQQMLEIMRALAADHRILIMDEPTASLGPVEREHLHRTLRGLREAGSRDRLRLPQPRRGASPLRPGLGDARRRARRDRTDRALDERETDHNHARARPSRSRSQSSGGFQRRRSSGSRA